MLEEQVKEIKDKGVTIEKAHFVEAEAPGLSWILPTGSKPGW